MNLKNVEIKSLAIISGMNAIAELNAAGLEQAREKEIQSAVYVY